MNDERDLFEERFASRFRQYLGEGYEPTRLDVFASEAPGGWLTLRSLAVAATAVVAVIGTAVTLTFLGDATPSLPPGVGTSAEPTGSVDVVPSATPFDGLTWSGPTTLAGVSIFDCIGTDAGWLAVGVTLDGAKAVWLSQDGATWTQQQLPPDMSGYSISRALEVNGKTVLIGSADDSGESKAWVWSDLGSSSPLPDDTFGHGQVVGAVAGTGGAVAYGTLEGHGAVWHTSDGEEWELAGEFETATFRSAAATAGGFVLVGRVGDTPSSGGGVISLLPTIGSVWWSPDGVAWTPVTIDTHLVEGGELVRVLAVANGLVAVGYDPTGSEAVRTPSVWTSTDGLAWHRSPVDPQIAASIVGSDSSTAVALVAGPSEGAGLNAWLSRDGAAWDSSAVASNGMLPVVVHGPTDRPTVELVQGSRGRGFIVVASGANGSDIWTFTAP